MSIDRPNLANAFTPKPRVDRSAALTGLLPPARRRPTALDTRPAQQSDQIDRTSPAPTATGPDAATAEAARKGVESRPSRARQTADRQPASETADTVASVAVYLEPDLLEQVRTARRMTGYSYDELVVAAFAAVSDGDIRRQLQPINQPHQPTGMPTRQRRLRGTAGIQIQVRLTGPQRSWLDAKQETLGAPSRSALVAVVLRLHLAD